MTRQLQKLLALLLAMAVLTAACGSDDAEETTETDSSSAASEETDEATTEEDSSDGDAMGDAPTELDIAVVLEGVKEEGWNTAVINALDRIVADSPHDLAVTYELIENIDYPDGERIGRELANSGTYEMIVLHSAYVDAANVIAPEYPDIAFAVSGSGNDEAVGGNLYWIDVFIHEPAYLMGIVAGSMTETNKISAVAGFPFANVNAPVRAFIDGALSVNPDIESSVTYIESWFDVVTANESAVAQIAEGSDMIYAERLGPVEAASNAEGVYAFGHFTDQSELNPDLVLASAVASWDPALMTVIDAWYAYSAEGTPYAGPAKERIVFDSMVTGGSDITDLSASVPAEVAELVEATKEQILSGEFEVPFNDAPFE